MYQCIETIEQTNSSSSDLLDEPLDSSEVKWFTDESSKTRYGNPKGRVFLVSIDEFIEAKVLPAQTSAQKAEQTVLMTVLQLGKNKKLNIFAD